MNGDGRLDRRDVADIAAHLGSGENDPMTGGDLDGDGAVSIADLALLQMGLASAVSPAAVPEPATMILFIAGLFFAVSIWRRRRVG